MTAPPAATSGAGSPLDAVQQLQRVVHALAPVLRPQVLPKGAAYGLDLLLQQCATDAQRAALRALIHQHKPAAGSDESREESLTPFVVGAFDVEKKVFSIDKIEWLGREDALVHQLPRLMELQLESPEEAAAVIERFAQANGHAKGDVVTAQQCFNAAFSLQTILRAFPRPPIAIQGTVVQVSSDSDVRDAFGALFPSAKRPKKATGSNRKTSKPKKRKSKQ